MRRWINLSDYLIFEAEISFNLHGLEIKGKVRLDNLYHDHNKQLKGKDAVNRPLMVRSPAISNTIIIKQPLTSNNDLAPKQAQLASTSIFWKEIVQNGVESGSQQWEESLQWSALHPQRSMKRGDKPQALITKKAHEISQAQTGSGS